MINEQIIHDCRYIENYQFKVCHLTRCKNYSDSLKSHCIAAERKESVSDKPISDAELTLFKLKDKGILDRAVSLKRKAAIDRIKASFVLEQYIDYIRKNHSQKEGFLYRKIHLELQSILPLKHSLFKFKPWMWPFLEDLKIYEVFIRELKGESQDLDLEDLLWLNKTKSKKLFSED